MTIVFSNLPGDLGDRIPGVDFEDRQSFSMDSHGFLLGVETFRGGLIWTTREAWVSPMEGSVFDQAELSFGYGGLFVELGNVRGSLGAFIGSIVGFGDVSLRLSRVHVSFDEVIKGGRPKPLRLSRSFLMIQPYISIELKVLSSPWLSLRVRIEVGHLLGLMEESWKLADGTKVSEGPNITVSAPVVSLVALLSRKAE